MTTKEDIDKDNALDLQPEWKPGDIVIWDPGHHGSDFNTERNGPGPFRVLVPLGIKYTSIEDLEGNYVGGFVARCFALS